MRNYSYEEFVTVFKVSCFACQYFNIMEYIDNRDNYSCKKEKDQLEILEKDSFKRIIVPFGKCNSFMERWVLS